MIRTDQRNATKYHRGLRLRPCESFLGRILLSEKKQKDTSAHVWEVYRYGF